MKMGLRKIDYVGVKDFLRIFISEILVKLTSRIIRKSWYEIRVSLKVDSTAVWIHEFIPTAWELTDTGDDSKLVHRRKRPKVDTLFSSLFFWRVRATSMTQRRVENTRVHFWTFLPISVNTKNNLCWTDRFRGLKRSGPFVFNWCVELTGVELRGTYMYIKSLSRASQRL